MKKIAFSRTRSLRLLRNSALAFVATGAAYQTVSAVAPNMLPRLAGSRLFVSGQSPARKQAEAWRRSRPQDAALMEHIAAQPTAKWIGGWVPDVRAEVARVSASAAAQGAVPVFVAYNIPSRDCGSYSAGGSSNAAAYRKWIRQFAAGLSGNPVVVLEPDAVAGANCLSTRARAERNDLLRDAIQVLKAARAVVYLDAGHARWHKPAAIAERLSQAGIAQADGFSLNVSNFLSTPENAAYGDAVSRLVGGKHYIIDTSRNGRGGNGEWCNPRGRGLGEAPTTRTGRPRVDAYLWIKQPGESDGTCAGGPRAGAWWAEYALELARNQVTTLASR